MATSTTAPAPIAVPATGEWDGNDGDWSTFRIAVGTPPQDFRVLVSTRGHETWVVLPEGCTADDPSDCAQTRGAEPFNGAASPGFQTNESTTWDLIGLYNLGLEDDLNLHGNGQYGYDTVHLGSGQDPFALEMEHQVVAGIATKDFYMGLLGVTATSSSFSSVSDPVTSLVDNMKQKGKIPSLSYAYTAGAQHRKSTLPSKINPDTDCASEGFKKVPGNLVLGGYDQSRFEWPDFSFTFSTDSDRTLVVGVQSITTSDSLEGLAALTSGGHLSAIDSTAPYLWLPEDVCGRFVTSFGLIYDNTTDLYLWNETIREDILQMNPTFTFKLGNEIYTSDSNSTNIEVPFAAFDLQISTPYYENATRYFPIRKANNTNQYTIGRALLQEAYLIVDQERRNFTIAQTKFSDPLPDAQLVAIEPPGADIPTSGSSGLSTGATIGIAVGAGAVGLLALLALLLCCRRRRRTRREEEEAAAARQAELQATQEPKPYDPWRWGISEAGHNQILEMGAGYTDQDKAHRAQELDAGRDVAYELCTNHAVFEMDGNAPLSPREERK